MTVHNSGGLDSFNTSTKDVYEVAENNGTLSFG